MRNDVSIREVKHPRYSHRVLYPGADGETKVKWFKTLTAAGVFAKKRKAELGDHGLSFGSIAEEERAAVQFWRGFVATVPDAPPPPMIKILQDFAGKWKATRSSVTVAAAVTAYEAAKKAEGLRARSVQSIRTRCKRFVDAFGSRLIGSITTAEISDWILSLPALVHRGSEKPRPRKDGKPHEVGLLAKRNQRLALSGLFTYAKSRGWVTENPVTDASRPKPPKSRPGVLRPDEVARLFGALEKVEKKPNAPALVPFWAVRIFAGIREQEAVRMDWSMVDLDVGEIHLPDTITKTGRARSVKIEPALSAFLSPYKKATGPIVTKSEMARIYHLRKAWRILQVEDAKAAAEAEEVGGEAPRRFPVPMPANAARHSFATYHLLAFRHAGETALQLGHGQSPELLHRHYKGIATEAEAKIFWSIRPAGSVKNVVRMKSAAKKAAAGSGEEEKPKKTRKRA